MSHPIGRLDQPTIEALVLLGSVLRDLRALHGLTQRQLARRCGLDQSTISRLENGKAPGTRAAWIARLLAGLEQAPYWPGEEPWNSRTPPGWILLMERFAARRRHLGRPPGFTEGRKAWMPVDTSSRMSIEASTFELGDDD